MKIIRFSTPGLRFPDGFHFRLGLLEGETVADLTANDPDTFGSVAGLLRLDDPAQAITAAAQEAPKVSLRQVQIEVPMDVQEVWAAGLTYRRESSGGDIFDRAYNADRPELFLKSTAERVAGPEQHIRMREDSRRTLPEPELVLVINYAGAVIGYTIGNDVTARDISAENPLYVPQAKFYRGSCALGPAIVLASAISDPKLMEISIRVERGEVRVFQGQTTISQMKRTFDELVGWLLRENDFASGVFLLTGSGITPPDNFALDHGDVVEIEIPQIGVLRNVVE